MTSALKICLTRLSGKGLCFPSRSVALILAFVITEFGINVWGVLLELAPWLLGGTLIAGLMHVTLPRDFIERHMGGRSWQAVFKAVLLGVPMPLCSCGVIPAAIAIKK